MAAVLTAALAGVPFGIAAGQESGDLPSGGAALEGAARVPSDQTVMPPASAWALRHAAEMKTASAGSGFEDLREVGRMIGDARIVALGEPTHGTREAFQMKHRLLEYLVEEKGFSIFSIEANMPESFALNEYVIEGRGDPKALIAGMYFWTWNTEEVLAMVEWMRDWNRRNPPEGGRPRLRFTGFDMQTHDKAWGIAHEFVLAHAPDLAAQSEPLSRDMRAVAARASLGSTQGGFTSATGSFPVEAARGKMLRLSAWIKTRGVTGWAGAWWRCDTPAGVNGFENMQDRQIKGDTEWTRHEFAFPVPADTTNINFGFLLSGDGAAWFDDVEVELDGVRYEDPAAFSFDFENDAVKFLSGGSGEYTTTRTRTEARGGAQSLEIKRRPESEVPKVDAADVAARAAALADALAARRDALATAAGAEQTDWAIRNARVVAQGAAMFARPDGFNARDEAMADNAAWILDQRPGERMVLWAHNLHVAREPFSGMVPMGRTLDERFGTDMVIVGFAAGAGTYTAMSPSGGLAHNHELAAPPADSVEAVLAGMRLPIAVVDLRPARSAAGVSPETAWAMEPRPFRVIGAMASPAQFQPYAVGRAFDLLVWQAETTASVPIR